MNSKGKLVCPRQGLFRIVSDYLGQRTCAIIIAIGALAFGEQFQSGFAAATLIVTNLADSGPGSLREAITIANGQIGQSTISLQSTGRITLTSQLPIVTNGVNVIGPGSSLFDISGTNGFRAFALAAGTTNSISGVTISGSGIASTGWVSIVSCSFTNNWATNGLGGAIQGAGTLLVTNCYFDRNSAYNPQGDGYGGAIHSSGTLVINNCYFDRNAAVGKQGSSTPGGPSAVPLTAAGGAVYAAGNIVVRDSYFSRNQAVGGSGSCYFSAGGGCQGAYGAIGQGGAIYLSGDGSIQNSCFAQNSAVGGSGGDGTGNVGTGFGATAYGGGLRIESGNATLMNVTFSQNSARGGADGSCTYCGSGGGASAYGGAIAGPAELLNCTIVSNSVYRGGSPGGALGGGIYSSDSASTARNCIVAQNLGTEADISGLIISRGHNLIQSIVGATNLLFTDITNTAPRIEALADNGGPTPTHALSFDSRALDAGDDAGAPTTDQRGVTRPKGAHVDIGAYERVPSIPIFLQTASDTNLVAGMDLTFGVSVVGTIPVTLQWYKDSQRVNAATSANFIIHNVQLGDVGKYSVVAQNPLGSTTNVAVVSVSPGPFIEASPQSATFAESTTPVLQVRAFGVAPLSYTWFFGSLLIPWTNGPSLMLTNFQGNNVGDYSVIVSNAFGSATSTVAHVSIWSSFVVSNNAPGGPGSLAEAILLANVTSNADRRDIILTNLTGSIVLTSSLPLIQANMAIRGPSARSLTINGNSLFRAFSFATGTTCLVSGLTISGTFATNAGGAAVFNGGALTVSNCLLINNRTVAGFGGAICNTGALTIVSSAILSNGVAGGDGGNCYYDRGGGGGGAGFGGGLFTSGGAVQIMNCTISGNTASGGNGGGYTESTYNDDGGPGGGPNGGDGTYPSPTAGGFGGGGGGGTYYFVRFFGEFGTSGAKGGYGGGGGGAGGGVGSGNGGQGGYGGGNGGGVSTNSYQTTGGGGGAGMGAGVFIKDGNVEMVNSTIISNQALGGLGFSSPGSNTSGQNGAGLGAGIFNYTGSVSIVNTIVAQNSAQTNRADFGGIIRSGGFNFFGVTNDSVVTQNSDLVRPTTTFGSLALNGGETPTYALLPGSPAIDAGTTNGAPLLDQRGFIRLYGSSVDIGAYEYGSAPGYELTVGVNGSGIVTLNPNFSVFPSNTIVTVTATPNAGFAFASWSGDRSGTFTNLTIRLTRAMTVTASFVPIIFDVAAQLGGTVTVSPNKALYSVGESVSFQAIPERWYEFTRWNDGATINPRIIDIGASNWYRAVFAPTTTLETVTIAGSSRTAPVGMPAIVLDGHFILAGAYTNLRSAQLIIQSTFSNADIHYSYDGTAPSVASRRYTGLRTLRRTGTIRALAFNSDRSISWESDPVAVVIIPAFDLEATTAGGGQILLSPTNGPHLSNTVVNVEAVPDAGWEFLQWLGDLEGTNRVGSVVMDSDRFVEAAFGTTFGGVAIGSGTGSVVVDNPGTLYPFGYELRMNAVPNAGSYFQAWAWGETRNFLRITPTQPGQTVVAVFGLLRADERSLTVVVSGRGSVEAIPHKHVYTAGETVVLRAVPDENEAFLGWNGNMSTENPMVLTIDSNQVVVAHFTARTRLQWRVPARIDGPLQITVEGDANSQDTIEATEDWKTWNPLISLTNRFGRIQWNAPKAGTTRGFRAVNTE